MIHTIYSGQILIVEDDLNTAALVATYLKKEGFQTLTAIDGEQALNIAQREQPIFIILDVMLPKIDGWEVCRQLRKTSNVPILMLTAREEEIDRIMGLSIGADDYVVKPFSPRELVERVKAILRRTLPASSVQSDKLISGPLVCNLTKHKVTLNDIQLRLTTLEYKLLITLMKLPGQVFSRNELLHHLYEQGENVVDRVIDVHIGKLRQKIGDNPSSPRFILTVRGFGYQFIESNNSPKT